MGLFDQSNHIGFTQILLFILYVNYFVYSSYQFSAIKPNPNQLLTFGLFSQSQTNVKPKPKLLSDYFWHSFENLSI